MTGPCDQEWITPSSTMDAAVSPHRWEYAAIVPSDFTPSASTPAGDSSKSSKSWKICPLKIWAPRNSPTFPDTCQPEPFATTRSEERRVGKECRSRGGEEE